MLYKLNRTFIVIIFAFITCSNAIGNVNMSNDKNFGQDAAFLKQYTDGFVLSDANAQIAIVPAYQARVMTSSAEGEKGKSIGWINHDLIKKGVQKPESVKGTLEEHMYAFGGEERFWIGPEGGQYSIFFAPKTEFTFANWFVPQLINTDSFKLLEKKDKSASFGKKATLTNWSGTKFEIDIKREIKLLDKKEAEMRLKTQIPGGLKMVAYESANKLTNSGKQAWTKEAGLLSIWILGMYKAADSTVVFAPINDGNESQLGYQVKDNYFGKVPSERLKIVDNVIYFSGDAGCRSKIGINDKRSKGVIGSYDPQNRILTILTYNQPKNYVGYVNSLWEMHKEPYSGDVLNSYNDGPLTDGKQMGKFYEIESSSPAVELKAGETLEHIQSTIHLIGSEEELNKVCEKIFSISIEKIKSALK